jgi:hypothetical protein
MQDSGVSGDSIIMDRVVLDRGNMKFLGVLQHVCRENL